MFRKRRCWYLAHLFWCVFRSDEMDDQSAILVHNVLALHSMQTTQTIQTMTRIIIIIINLNVINAA